MANYRYRLQMYSTTQNIKNIQFYFTKNVFYSNFLAEFYRFYKFFSLQAFTILLLPS